MDKSKLEFLKKEVKNNPLFVLNHPEVDGDTFLNIISGGFLGVLYEFLGFLYKREIFNHPKLNAKIITDFINQKGLDNIDDGILKGLAYSEYLTKEQLTSLYKERRIKEVIYNINCDSRIAFAEFQFENKRFRKYPSDKTYSSQISNYLAFSNLSEDDLLNIWNTYDFSIPGYGEDLLNIRYYILINKNCPKSLMEFEGKNFTYLSFLVKNPNCPVKFLERAIQYSSISLDSLIANPKLPSTILQHIWNNKKVNDKGMYFYNGMSIRLFSLAVHPNLPENILWELYLRDKSDDLLRRILLENSNCPLLLLVYATGMNSNPDFTKQILATTDSKFIWDLAKLKMSI